MAAIQEPSFEVHRIKIVLETPALGWGEVRGKLLPPSLVAVIDHSVHAATEQIFAELPNAGEAACIRLHALNRGSSAAVMFQLSPVVQREQALWATAVFWWDE
ncbi:hypothetical protein D3C73_1143010 [compost metagenome]